MDLVSSTLNRYLKHRFNGDGEMVEKLTNNDNGISQADGEYDNPVKVYNISFSNLTPCCVAFREDLRYLAAGFENSHIYLWSLDIPQPEQQQPQHEQQQQQPDQLPRQNHEDPLQSEHHTNSIEDHRPENTSDSVSGGIKIDTRSKLLAHSGSIYCIQFIENKDLMLSCSEDTTIRLWCLKTKCNLNVYRGHNYPVWSITMGTQGEYFASASMDTTARLWRLDQSYPLRIFCGHDDDVECVQFHPNEKYIATGSSDATVRLWSTADGKMVRLMVGHEKPIVSLSFLPNGKFLASASSEGSIKVWNLATNRVANDLSVPPSHTISFSSKQEFVSTCGVDNVLHLWRIVDLRLVEKKKFDFTNQYAKPIKSHFHGDNKLFVVLRVPPIQQSPDEITVTIKN